MWQMDIFIRHKCGECKNTVGHALFYITSIIISKFDFSCFSIIRQENDELICSKDPLWSDRC